MLGLIIWVTSDVATGIERLNTFTVYIPDVIFWHPETPNYAAWQANTPGAARLATGISLLGGFAADVREHSFVLCIWAER